MSARADVHVRMQFGSDSDEGSAHVGLVVFIVVFIVLFSSPFFLRDFHLSVLLSSSFASRHCLLYVTAMQRILIIIIILITLLVAVVFPLRSLSLSLSFFIYLLSLSGITRLLARSPAQLQRRSH